MVIEPKILNNICISAHPLGCEKQVQEQIDFIKEKKSFKGPKNILVIGSSNGYGLAARITAAFGAGASSLGISFERGPSGKRTGTAGWYNEKAFLKLAGAGGLNAWTINGDAFSDEIKQEAGQIIRENMGKIDLLIYSIAAPRRTDPDSGEVFSSVLKPIGESYKSRLMDFKSGELSEVELTPASEKEIADTVKVMGGEDWKRWIDTLKKEELLAGDFSTIAFSYIGPELTAPIYREGSIGEAKKNLEASETAINEALKDIGGRAYISINKALVTRASAVIPGFSLYISLLYKVMKERGSHENCIQQMERLFYHVFYKEGPVPVDGEGRIRLDDLEMNPEVQAETARLWEQLTEDNLEHIADIQGFRREFLKHHGFGISGVDYSADIEP